MAIALDPFKGIFGLPPSTWVSDDMITNSMPIFEITPAEPDFESGLNLFRVTDASEAYSDILRHHGYTTPTPIKLAFIADNFPTDSFTNDYGETFLQKFTDVASQGMSQIAQMTGSKEGTKGIIKIGDALSDAGKGLDGVMGSALTGVGNAASGLAGGIDKLMNKMDNNEAGGLTSLMGGGAKLVNKMLAGARVDFPQIWRNSGYTPSYTATIRLYNPNPGSAAATEKYIIGPLAVLLTLGLPRSEEGSAYNWPFFHKIKAKGIYGLDPAAITNITVIKGGDQQQIAYNQSLAMVDVRLDFTSLYNSILVEEKGPSVTNRPTLRTYLNSMKENKSDNTLSVKRSKLRENANAKVNGLTLEDQLIREDEKLIQISKNEAAKRRQTPLLEETAVTDRGGDGNAAQTSTLISGSNFYTVV